MSCTSYAINCIQIFSLNIPFIVRTCVFGVHGCPVNFWGIGNPLKHETVVLAMYAHKLTPASGLVSHQQECRKFSTGSPSFFPLTRVKLSGLQEVPWGMFYLASSTDTCAIHVIPVSVQTIRAPFLRTGSAHDSLLLMRRRVI